MHIGRHIVQEVVLRLGQPLVERWTFDMAEEEFAVLRGYIAVGRAHDVTSVVSRGDEVAVVRERDYPPNAYRFPSGGVHPEEAFLDGAAREAREETGLDVIFERYLLQIHATFVHGDERITWTTHVLSARPVGGDLKPAEAEEIETARWIDWKELLQKVGPILEGSGRGGLAYIARLHQKAHELLFSSGDSSA